MKIGLYFGSFNPIHNGHLMIANYMAEYSDLEQVWFVISPQNPFKQKSSLLADYHRYEMVVRAIGDYSRFKASNIEFKLPQPSYTADTLAHLHDKYPQHEFALIMGGDNLATFEKWKNYQAILQYYRLYVYPRPDIDISRWLAHPQVTIVNAPLIEISSSFIRQAITEKRDVRFFMQKDAFDYLNEMHFYE